MPPGPVSVTNRTPGVCSSFETAPRSCSRPINDVDVTGNERGPRRSESEAGDAPRPARAPAVPNRSLRSSARSSRTSRPSSRGVRNDRYDSVPSDWSSSIMAVSRGSRSGAGVLTYRSRGIEWESRNSSSRPEMSMPGPIQPYRCQYSPTKMCDWAKYARYSSRGGCGRAPSSNSTGVSRSRRDGTGHRGALIGELGKRGAHEDAQALIRRPNVHQALIALGHTPSTLPDHRRSAHSSSGHQAGSARSSSA